MALQFLYVFYIVVLATGTDQLGEDAKGIFSGFQNLAQIISDFMIHLLQTVGLNIDPIFLIMISFGIIVGIVLAVFKVIGVTITKITIFVIMIIVAAVLMLPVFPA